MLDLLMPKIYILILYTKNILNVFDISITEKNFRNVFQLFTQQFP